MALFTPKAMAPISKSAINKNNGVSHGNIAIFELILPIFPHILTIFLPKPSFKNSCKSCGKQITRKRVLYMSLEQKFISILIRVPGPVQCKSNLEEVESLSPLPQRTTDF